VFATLDDRGGHYTWKADMWSPFVTHDDDPLVVKEGMVKPRSLAKGRCCGQSRRP